MGFFKVTIDKSYQDHIAKSISQLSDNKLRQAARVVQQVARACETKARQMASERLRSTRQMYSDNLFYKDLGNGIYTITLRSQAAHLEEGYSGYDMKPGLLKQGMGAGDLAEYNQGRAVDLQTRKQQGQIHTSKDGYRYRAIPFEHNMSHGKSGSPFENDVVQKWQSYLGNVDPQTVGDKAADQFRMIQSARIRATIQNPDGTRAQGAVASIHRLAGDQGMDLAPHEAVYRVKNLVTGNQQDHIMHSIPDTLAGLTKIQFGRNKTAYMTWRMVSENPVQANKWFHPGFYGVNIFPELEQWAIQQINERLGALLKQG